ncbi:hypothetical protein WR25_23763 [Diploscapter pachys]|uniref:Uncharacterized protein n=1 Tax=Diploscapter pachys TaxID=2018661 RepID=A0A2A2M153_9BILA|nr:hypothetical protein WR25_23763 [Diploscapter pachys]
MASARSSAAPAFCSASRRTFLARSSSASASRSAVLRIASARSSAASAFASMAAFALSAARSCASPAVSAGPLTNVSSPETTPALASACSPAFSRRPSQPASRMPTANSDLLIQRVMPACPVRAERSATQGRPPLNDPAGLIAPAKAKSECERHRDCPENEAERQIDDVVRQTHEAQADSCAQDDDRHLCERSGKVGTGPAACLNRRRDQACDCDGCGDDDRTEDHLTEERQHLRHDPRTIGEIELPERLHQTEDDNGDEDARPDHLRRGERRTRLDGYLLGAGDAVVGRIAPGKQAQGVNRLVNAGRA